MSKFTHIAYVSNFDMHEFTLRVSDRVDKHQKKGLVVEVQYQPVAVKDSVLHCALILAREGTHENN